MTDTKIDLLRRISDLEHQLQEARRVAATQSQRAIDLQALLDRLHAVAKHGSVRSGALTYLRDELISAFQSEKNTEAPDGDK